VNRDTSLRQTEATNLTMQRLGYLENEKALGFNATVPYLYYIIWFAHQDAGRCGQMLLITSAAPGCYEYISILFIFTHMPASRSHQSRRKLGVVTESLKSTGSLIEMILFRES
jgi:hypothetical protein